MKNQSHNNYVLFFLRHRQVEVASPSIVYHVWSRNWGEQSDALLREFAAVYQPLLHYGTFPFGSHPSGSGTPILTTIKGSSDCLTPYVLTHLRIDQTVSLHGFPHGLSSSCDACWQDSGCTLLSSSAWLTPTWFIMSFQWGSVEVYPYQYHWTHTILFFCVACSSKLAFFFISSSKTRSFTFLNGMHVRTLQVS